MSENNGSSLFTNKELARYSRHVTIPEFGREGQERLKRSKVLVIGTGGLGAPALLYLTAAGVGEIGIVDFDKVEDSNLQRQVLFGTEDIGRPKIEVAKEKLENLNPNVKINIHETQLTSDNALEIFKGYDIVADGTDNFPTRYLVNDASVFAGIPNVYASIFRFEGQASVFNYTDSKGVTGPNYRDLYPSPPPPGLVPSCAEGGVLGVLPGIIGSIQATEVIKILSGAGEPLSGRFFIFDALNFETRTLNVEKDPENPLTGENPTQTGLIDYEEFCGITPEPEQEESEVPEVTPEYLATRLNNGSPIKVIDVREPHEYEIANIDGELIPLGDIDTYVDQIPKDQEVVVHCRSGKRSADAIKKLQSAYGYNNLYNLKGGILAYAKEVDQSLATY
jgi:molybdopterin/thiamine biosynthesis adenylyltransferase/rhodanese-related sulfurtransferase